MIMELKNVMMQRQKPAEAVGTGDRSEKIRTYNFLRKRVTDHRIKLTLHRLDNILNGDLEEIIDSLIAADQARNSATFRNSKLFFPSAACLLTRQN